MSGSTAPRSGPVGVALIGAGTISAQYLTNLTQFPDVEVVAVTDLRADAAAARAEEFSVPLSGGIDVALQHPDVDIVVNLTTPAAHVDTSVRAIEAGKHVWSEKPLALDVAGGVAVRKAAEAAGVLIGCAPDTLLGSGLQSAFRAIEAGEIGTPLTAHTMFQTPGPASWHPDPAFLFQAGAGPLFDMGPYYLSALVQVFGSVHSVAATASTAQQTLVIGSGPRAGESFEVTEPTHVAALIRFEAGASAQSTFSFQSHRTSVGVVEINGSEGTIALSDPNSFTGEPTIHRRGADDWEALPVSGSRFGRGTGVVDLARAIRTGRTHRAGGDLALHVLDALVAIRAAVDSGGFESVSTSASPAALLPEGWDPSEATLG